MPFSLAKLILGSLARLAKTAPGAFLLAATACAHAGRDEPASAPQPPPAPPAASAPRAFELFESIRPSPEVKAVCERLSYQPMPLISHWRFFNERDKLFDAERYARSIWTPDRQMDEPPHIGGWEKYGIPPGYGGWVDLDMETPLDARTGPEYEAFIKETRRLRPEAKICLHGYILREEAKGERGELVHRIVSLCDAISPPIYPQFTADYSNVTQQLHACRNRIRWSLDLKARHGVKVFPAMWKRHGKQPQIYDAQGRKVRDLTPPEIVRSFADLVVTEERNGLRCDGIVVWGNDPLVLYRSPQKTPPLDFVHPDTPDQKSADASDIRFLEIVAEAVAGRRGP